MYEVPLERGKIREFARATMARDETYDARDAAVPPTFLTTAMNLWEPQGELDYGSFTLDLARVLHGEEEFVFPDGPPTAGQDLTVTARLGDVYEKPGRRGGTLTFVKLIHEFRDPEGRTVAEQRTTLIQTSQPPEGS
ncbi:MaoC dehydratase-like protein [Tamaricihabitans halophyticus]|uniref:MaoC dehydratase-like protein n=1 Tax=Tamaricihabitans halophyticus TaxID=1262583 RepID=A0A4R2R1X6_9PSEU|nr:MaoC family dehydratase N-terminal domain-containing protein [Tamaricihabitans halophyticus]TCP53471.1 MaoC dehydratase-like protein [Tamaricihabitans halophyticus]